MKLFSRKEVAQSSDRLFNPRTVMEIIGMDGISVFGDVSKQNQLKYFLQVPELNHIITTKARLFAKMKLTVRSKITGQELPKTNRIQKVLSAPNWQQTQKEFLTLNKIFKEIYGNEYIHFLYPLGFSKKSTYQMSTLNQLNLELKEPRGGLPPFLRTGIKDGTVYRYLYEGKYYEIPFADILHLNNNNVKNDLIGGQSPIESIKPNLDNIISAYESRGILLRNRGALGILSNSSRDQNGSIVPFDDDEMKKIQDQYKKFGLSRNQWQIIITNLTLKWQSMVMSPKDLMLFEEIEADFQKLCDMFGFKSEMFSTSKGSTFENAKQYEKSAYQNTIMPEAQEFVNGLNDYFETEKESFVIVGEFENLHIFDEDKKERAETITLTNNYLSVMYTQGLITLEQYQAELKKWGIGDGN